MRAVKSRRYASYWNAFLFSCSFGETLFMNLCIKALAVCKGGTVLELRDVSAYLRLMSEEIGNAY